MTVICGSAGMHDPEDARTHGRFVPFVIVHTAGSPKSRFHDTPFRIQTKKWEVCTGFIKRKKPPVATSSRTDEGRHRRLGLEKVLSRRDLVPALLLLLLTVRAVIGGRHRRGSRRGIHIRRENLVPHLSIQGGAGLINLRRLLVIDYAHH